MNLIIIIIKAFRFPFKLFQRGYNQFLKKYIDYIFLKFHGVETKVGYVLLKGFPIIVKHSKARIVIGKGTILVSKSKYNFAGINHPVIIAAAKENAFIHIHGSFGGSGCTIVADKLIEIKEMVGIGVNSCVYDTDFHPVGWAKNSETKNASIIIEKNVWVAANSIILKGIIIGENSVIGAGSVVTKNVNKNSIYAGNPAKFIKYLEDPKQTI